MSLKKILSPLRNAFSYAVHLESAEDFARKPAIAEAVAKSSLPPPEGVDDGYEARLRAVLMKTRTKRLEVLLKNDVSVILDERLSRQKLGGKDRRVDGIFYDRPGARSVTVWDDGKKSKSNWLIGTPAENASVMLEKLADALSEGKRGNLYASRYTTMDGGMGAGIAGHVTFTQWTPPQHFEPGVFEKNPALTQPPAKPAAPKPAQ